MSRTTRLLDYRRILYELKRDFGFPVSVYKAVTNEPNLQTGETITVESRTQIRRAVILPVSAFTKFFRHATIVDFEYGGDLSVERRVFVIDQKDLRQEEVTESSSIIYDHKRYTVEMVNNFEFKQAYYVVAKHLVGQLPGEQIVQALQDWVQPHDGVTT